MLLYAGGRTDAFVQRLHDGLERVQGLVDHRWVRVRRRHLQRLQHAAPPCITVCAVNVNDGSSKGYAGSDAGLSTRRVTKAILGSEMYLS